MTSFRFFYTNKGKKVSHLATWIFLFLPENTHTFSTLKVDDSSFFIVTGKEFPSFMKEMSELGLTFLFIQQRLRDKTRNVTLRTLGVKFKLDIDLL